MPELPEVETTRRGLEPLIVGRRIRALRVRERRLRQPIPRDLEALLAGTAVTGIARRAKYLLLETECGNALIHLGMSGSLRVVNEELPPTPHEHYDLLLDGGHVLRYRDPRRFGLLLWAGNEPERHPLLARLGPEPLGPDFDGAYLYRASRDRRAPVKAFLMDSRIVAGIGNIYANEALYAAGIHPRRAAGRIGATRYMLLTEAIRTVLIEAIAAGGTTLRDFVAAKGNPGYFRIRLAVYDRAGADCPRCGTPIRRSVIAQRATYYCPRCQRY
ncbi:MAG: bifunctional DNA-formamidopyrimidine glycosylase/DNA-(apurinic or apyrimidinic site) lyase [Gammaproteobacteria bacterium]